MRTFMEQTPLHISSIDLILSILIRRSVGPKGLAWRHVSCLFLRFTPTAAPPWIVVFCVRWERMACKGNADGFFLIEWQNRDFVARADSEYSVGLAMVLMNPKRYNDITSSLVGLDGLDELLNYFRKVRCCAEHTFQWREWQIMRKQCKEN
jgi:hypothetical protein